jgi:hypothetical protein
VSVTLSADEVRQITGYRRGAEQLAELHRQGYWRARRSPITGAVIVERAHYDAVCSGADVKPRKSYPVPRLRTA